MKKTTQARHKAARRNVPEGWRLLREGEYVNDRDAILEPMGSDPHRRTKENGRPWGVRRVPTSGFRFYRRKHPPIVRREST